MLGAMKKKDEAAVLLVKEFLSCQNRVLELCKDNTITLVTRKSKRDRIKTDLKDVRKQVVDASEQTGRNNITDYNIITVVKYKEKNKKSAKGRRDDGIRVSRR